MRLPLTGCLLLGLAVAPPVHAAEKEGVADLSSRQCGVSTPYNVLVDSGGIWLRQPGQVPAEIFFHDGELNIDRTPVPVSAADAQRLRQLEWGTRQLVPAVAGLAGQVVDITFDAFSATVEILSGSKGKARQVAKLRVDAQDYVDRTLGRGIWEQADFGDGFEQRVEQAAESMADSLARGVMWSMFTGGAQRMEARANKVEAQLERTMETRARALEAQAQALCTQVLALDQLQQALEVRYQGRPLAMMMMDRNEDAPAPREQPRSDAVALPRP
ncbi:YggN family protein [Bacillus subtilis subsp. subtilis]|nr:YggN family protein [Bacillus subtilis subsp. subtilis]